MQRVLTEIDLQATLKKKIDVDVAPYVILGACNPKLAHQALGQELGFGVLMLQGADLDFLRRKFTRASLKRTVRVDFANPQHQLAARVLARLDLLGHLTFEAFAPPPPASADAAATVPLASGSAGRP